MTTPTPGAAPQMAAEQPLERIGPEICTADAQFAIARICDSHPETERLFDALVARYNAHADPLSALEAMLVWSETLKTHIPREDRKECSNWAHDQARAALAKAKAGAQ